MTRWTTSVMQHPVMQRMAHADPYVWSTIAALAMLRHVVHLWPAWLALGYLAAWLVMSLAGLTSATAHVFHLNQMCVWCGKGLLTNRRQRTLNRWLWLDHHQWMLLLPFAAIFGARLGYELPTWIVIVTDLLMFAAAIILSQAVLNHRIHVAFCPWCSDGWGRDGDAHPEPSLDPTSPGKVTT